MVQEVKFLLREYNLQNIGVRGFALMTIFSALLFAGTACSEKPVASYVWEPNNPPVGISVPWVGSYNNYHALVTNKYAEAYVDLEQGADDQLRIKGDMTLIAVFQVAKQWPMRAAIISKWDYIPGEAAYELGITENKKVYFRISSDGRQESAIEVVSKDSIPLEKSVVVAAVFEPSKRMAIYIDGFCNNEIADNIPSKINDSPNSVKLLQRFEGLLGGVFFYAKTLHENKVKKLSEEISALLPDNVPYKNWKKHKRKLVQRPADYLGTSSGMTLYREIDISAYKGSYVCLGDMDNDSRLDFLLYKNGSTYNIPGRLTAIDFDGRVLWEKGDPNLTEHEKCGTAFVGQKGTTPALRGIATIFDIDGDGRTEVISELLDNGKPMLLILDGQTGQVKHRINSPLDMSIRQPKRLGLRQPSRSHPVIRIAWLDGKDKLPSIILKYGASNGIPCHAFALDPELNILWHIEGTKHSMGHVPTVADVDEDDCDEIVFGHMLADSDGSVIWDRGQEFQWHADTTSVDELIPGNGKQILISVCGIGPVYCLNPTGDILWQKTREEIAHGQAVWVGNFIEDLPGKEIIALASGHVGHFITMNGDTGETVARFNHRKLMPSYPDFPSVVNWKSKNVQSLWIPQDRILADGRGNIIAELGHMDEYVNSKLNCGTSWRPVGAQAFAADICGDQRDELVIYEPYAGESIFIFTQADSDQTDKPFIASPGTYNIRSYF